jgi:hypothetical protein
VRLIDTVLRQGHLSEQAIIEAVMSGDRPHHLDRCDICSERAVQMARWMDDVSTDATELADATFTPERLQAQQDQILRRLEQLDHPARVIAFPAASRQEPNGAGGRRVAVSWVAVAAAAGLVIGVVSGQMSARMSPQPAAPTSASAAPSTDPTLASNDTTPLDGSFLGQAYETLELPSLEAMNQMTPRISQVSLRK